jgi:type I restriction enzyme S subunit
MNAPVDANAFPISLASHIPLKHAAKINLSVLDESTDPDYAFDYVDISAVSPERGIVHREPTTFASAPSRARRVVAQGDTIVSTVRTYLRAVGFVENADHLVVSTGFAVLTPKAGVHPRYLYRAVQSKPFIDAVVARSTGVSYPAINPADLGCIPVPVPDRETQRAVADFLDRETEKIDASTAKKERLIDLLQEKRGALITHVVTKGLDPNVQLKDSGIRWLGEIPSDWEMRRLKQISPSQSVGLVINPSTYVVDEGVPFLFGSDIAEFHIHTNGVRHISQSSNELLAPSMLRAGDLVTVRVGDPGVTAVVPEELDRCNCASVMITRRSPTFDSKWLCYMMNSRVGRAQVEMVQYGAAQKQFNISHAVNFRYPLPPLTEQVRIREHLDEQVLRLSMLIQNVERGTEVLREYRSALITAAVTGQVDVREYAKEAS